MSQGEVDAVFWTRINTPDQSIFDSLPENRKGDATMIALALSPYRHPDIDIPEGTVTTDVYFHDIFVTLLALTCAPVGVSLNSRFFRPTVKGRMAFSLRLLERLRWPSSR